MSAFDHLIGGAKADPFDAAFPPLRMRAAPFTGPRRFFATIGGRQYQADAGSCTAHGFSAPIEGVAKARGADVQLCRQDLYYGARWVEGNGAERVDGGAYPSKMREWLSRYGTVSEARKPYRAADVTTWRPPAEWANDRALLATVYEPLRLNPDDIVSEVSNGRQVAICHAVYGTMTNLPADGIERGVSGANLGGHCRSVVGYDLDFVTPGMMTLGAALVMNSWQGWGLPHPAKDTDSRFAGYTDSFSWVPLPVLRDAAWLQDASRLVKVPEFNP